MYNAELNAMIIKVARRAETVPDDLLREAFVPVGSLLTHLASPQSQVLFGRRGTGKTHLLRYLRDLKAAEGALAIYVDLRKIGSPEDVFSRDQDDFLDQATGLLIDLIEHIHNAVCDYVLDDRWIRRLDEISDALDALATAATLPPPSGPFTYSGSTGRSARSASAGSPILQSWHPTCLPTDWRAPGGSPRATRPGVTRRSMGARPGRPLTARSRSTATPSSAIRAGRPWRRAR